MTHRHAGPVAVAALALLAVGCAPSQQPCSPTNIGLAQLKDAAVVGTIPEVDQVMAGFLAAPLNPVPGVAIGIMQNNQVTYLKGYGHADMGNLAVAGDEVPFTKNTMSRLGSISKTVTALGILKLIQQGHVNLDDPLSAHLPAVPPPWNALTIRTLLTHQGGLQDFPSEIANPEAWLNATYPAFAPHPGVHPRLAYYTYLGTPIQYPNLNPGHARYSNTGYSLLGAVIDHVTRQPGFVGRQGYEDFVWWNVGLRGGLLAEPTMPSLCVDTYWRHDAIKDVAKGYDKTMANVLAAAAYTARSGWEGPPGGWDATIGDLTRLAVALQTNKLLDAGTMAQMTSVQSLSIDRDLGQYGHGLFVGTVLDRPVFSHGGNIGGYTARLTVWPQQNFAITLLANRSNADLAGLEKSIAALFLGASPGLGSLAPRIRMTDADVRATRTAEYLVATQHLGRATRLVEQRMRETGSLEAALGSLRVRLATVDPTGRLLRAMEHGDYRTAAALYLEIAPLLPELR